MVSNVGLSEAAAKTSKGFGAGDDDWVVGEVDACCDGDFELHPVRPATRSITSQPVTTQMRRMAEP
ncbi:hypothetical protein MNVI_40950 [Mycobacterium noviomagense]|uniref:Uncharacterized protein n=1 Tax=Mycobacterium noviomagense TaxID=459858 RepID=A0A7I7PJI0_9MYCO|nr:hypothetical protein MNVI_40950 [Mycobacterium noviomagense]